MLVQIMEKLFQFLDAWWLKTPGDWVTGLLTFLRGRFKRRVRLFRKGLFFDIFEHEKMD